MRKRFLKRSYTKSLTNEIKPLVWENSIYYPVSYEGEKNFSFINLAYTFQDEIDWNHHNFGKLWTYNLNYFDFLNQENSKAEQGLNLINDYIKKEYSLKDGKEPYPISLRGINWIKFLSKNNIVDRDINQVLYNHYQILVNNIEYHLLGNHLLENGFSLFFGAYYFKDEFLYNKATKILAEELKEQVLNDGAHFELSPMYHQLVLHRLLDCIQLAELNPWKEDNLLIVLKLKAIKMLSWLEIVMFKNGTIPMVNDSTYNIAPDSKDLFEYAKKLGLKWDLIPLSDSGYRKFTSAEYELFVDVGNVGPTYQPGHAHSDTFNCILHVKNNPIIVDPGVSTYEKNAKRQRERETASHNTVKIGKQEQTEVWGGFRVAKRATIIEINEGQNFVRATHNGYKNKGIFHTRIFFAEKKSIIIEDLLSNESKEEQIAFFHFHPNINIISVNQQHLKIFQDGVEINFNFSENVLKIEKSNYDFALGFNKTVRAENINVYFNNKLKTTISF